MMWRLPVILLTLSACTSAAPRTGTGTGDKCIPGRAVQCWCDDGGVGNQICDAFGNYGACSCAVGGTTTGDPTADTVGPADVEMGGTDGGGDVPVVSNDDGPGPVDEGEVPQDEGPVELDDGPVVMDDGPGPVDTGPPVGSCEGKTFAPKAARIVFAGVPDNVGDYLCDSNGHSGIDQSDGDFNKLGSLVHTSGIDFADYYAYTIKELQHVLLLEFPKYQTGNAAGLTVNFHRGEAAEKQPQQSCDEKGGQVCNWTVDKEFLTPTCDAKSTFAAGEIFDDTLLASPGTLNLPIMVAENAWIDVPIQNATIAGLLNNGLNILNGRICGTFPRQPFVDALGQLCVQAPDLDICSLYNFDGYLESIFPCDESGTCTIILSFEAAPATLELAP